MKEGGSDRLGPVLGRRQQVLEKLRSDTPSTKLSEASEGHDVELLGRWAGLEPSSDAADESVADEGQLADRDVVVVDQIFVQLGVDWDRKNNLQVNQSN